MDTVQLVKILVWPLITLVIVLFFLIFFRDSIKKILEGILRAKGKVTPTGIEWDIERIESAVSLGAASAIKVSGPTTKNSPMDERQTRKIANTVNQIPTKLIRRLADASVLWVDDNPANNYYEKRSLEAFGIHFTISTSTADAIEKIRINKYDAIISDMGRSDDKQAGYKLLEEKQKLGDTAPFIIYAGSNLPEHKEEARRRGALGITNSPQELYQLVLTAIQCE